MLNPSDLTVESFPTNNGQLIGDGGEYCCTGCTSGCGIFPTNGGCESNAGASGDFACVETASVD